MINMHTIGKRSSHFLFLGALMVILYMVSSCKGIGDKNNQNDEGTIDTAQAESIPDTVAIKIGSDTLSVLPGESIGRFQLKGDVEKSNIFDLLGKADSADAAMCKSWAMWYWKDSVRNSSNEFDVYSSCDPDLDMRKSIQILRLSGAKFITDLGITEKSTLEEMKEMYPTIQSVGTFITPDGEEVVLLDDMENGISFEFDSTDPAAVIGAVLIHFPGKQITDSYLPFYSKKDDS